MAHIHKSIDFVVDAFIVFNNKVLMVDHKKLKLWLPLGGHIEKDEDPDQALFREVKEESGLEIELLNHKPAVEFPGTKLLHKPDYLDIHEISPTHKHVCFIYFAKAKTGQAALAETEHNAIRWFSLEDLDNPAFAIRPQIKFYAKESLKAVEKNG